MEPYIQVLVYELFQENIIHSLSQQFCIVSLPLVINGADLVKFSSIILA